MIGRFSVMWAVTLMLIGLAGLQASAAADPQAIALSAAEQAYLDRHAIIRFRSRTDRPPFEFSEKGQAAGVAADYIRLIASKVGFEPVFVFEDAPVDRAFADLAGGRAVYDTLMFSPVGAAQQDGFVYGDAYLSYPSMLITASHVFARDLSEVRGRVAVERGFLTETWLRRDFPDLELMPANGTYEALQLVDRGVADAYVGNLTIAHYYQSKGKLTNVKVSGTSPYGHIAFVFVAPERAAPLVSILSKGFQSLTPAEHASINQRWFAMNVLERFDYRVLWVAAAMIIAFSCVSLVWLRRVAAARAQTEAALVEVRATKAELELKNQELERLSLIDQLTRVANRARFDRDLAYEIERARRSGQSFGLIMADLDHFKAVNDSYGHQAGDQLLCDVAGLLESSVRNIDLVARWGGEEFVILCPETDLEGAEKLAEKLREIIAFQPFGELGARTASFGVSAFEPCDDIDSVVRRADKALYLAKDLGRNRVEVIRELNLRIGKACPKEMQS